MSPCKGANHPIQYRDDGDLAPGLKTQLYLLLPDQLKEKSYGFLAFECDFCLKVDTTTNWSGDLELIRTNIYECLWCISETNRSLNCTGRI